MSGAGRLGQALHGLAALDDLAARNTALAGFDPRVLLGTTLLFLVTLASFERHAVTPLLPLAAFPVALVALGHLPVALILRRVLVASPFAVMVGIWNPLFDTAPMPVAGFEVAGGWLSFLSILLRFALGVAAALALVAGIGMHGVCNALDRLGVPRLFTTQLLLLYRYLFVLGAEAERMLVARRLRGAGQAARPAPLATYGTLVGHLLLRAVDRAQRVHQAMLARGFDGRIRALHAPRWQRADTVFLAACVAGFALARAVDLPAAIGHLLAQVAA